MGGTGKVSFPVTTDSEDVQAFINQGVGQLHGFWYLEAERSFRQAAALDPGCAMAYWGAAMAAYSKRDRSKGFIEKAVELKEKLGDKLTEREQLYIDSLEKYFSDDSKDKKDKSKRAQAYLKALESIVIKYPDDIEAKAFVAHRIWHNAREGIPVSSYLATSALINEIYESDPLHPSNHYTIHLWDLRHPEFAVRAAARCGVSAPSIAHMWHMPGHIYSRLKRYEDAVYQQEASARVDHAHMMRDQVLPDEISNFAHNNEWLIRNLVFIGKAEDAINLAKNMTDLPRHPKYNTLDKRNGSASYGRRRLLQVLREFQLYEEAFELCHSSCLTAEDNKAEHVKTLRLLGCASAMTDRNEAVESVVEELKKLKQEKVEEQRKLKLKTARLSAALDTSKDRPPRPRGDKVDKKKAKVQLKESKDELGKIKKLLGQIDKADLAIKGYVDFGNEDFESAYKNLDEAKGEDVSLIGELMFHAGEYEKGLKKIEDQVKRRPQEVIPLARLVYLQFQNGDMDLAKTNLEKLRDTSTSIDMNVELFARLTPIAKEFGFGEQWLKTYKPASDLGFRPELDSLGPFRWSPSAAPAWSLKDSDNKTVASDDFDGQAHLLIFYLGHGCLHCAEQLHAFAPQVDEFEKAGVKMLAISTDEHEGLQESIKGFSGEMPIRLATDAKFEVFKKFRAFDDFEDQPLHGTFLIDGNGKIRWQDISYEPFMKHEFLLKEAKRLLADQNRASVKAENKGEKPKRVSLK